MHMIVGVAHGRGVIVRRPDGVRALWAYGALEERVPAPRDEEGSTCKSWWEKRRWRGPPKLLRHGPAGDRTREGFDGLVWEVTVRKD